MIEKMLAREFMAFVVSNLPNLLESVGSVTGDPLEALEAVGKAWRENRTDNIQDRSGGVAEARAEVDAKLAAKAKKTKSTELTEG